jgi:hypothetical protein
VRLTGILFVFGGLTMTEQHLKKLLTVEETREVLRHANRQQTYSFLREHPELTIRLGERSLRVDAQKLERWLDGGGVRGSELTSQATVTV